MLKVLLIEILFRFSFVEIIVVHVLKESECL